ncbi:MAG: hypothetical protein ACI9BD_001552 [Candidatus Marinamargulisbacteria bacterium]|jgi:hypothetical protein
MVGHKTISFQSTGGDIALADFVGDFSRSIENSELDGSVVIHIPREPLLEEAMQRLVTGSVFKNETKLSKMAGEILDFLYALSPPEVDLLVIGLGFGGTPVGIAIGAPPALTSAFAASARAIRFGNRCLPALTHGVVAVGEVTNVFAIISHNDISGATGAFLVAAGSTSEIGFLNQEKRELTGYEGALRVFAQEHWGEYTSKQRVLGLIGIGGTLGSAGILCEEYIDQEMVGHGLIGASTVLIGLSIVMGLHLAFSRKGPIHPNKINLANDFFENQEVRDTMKGVYFAVRRLQQGRELNLAQKSLIKQVFRQDDVSLGPVTPHHHWTVTKWANSGLSSISSAISKGISSCFERRLTYTVGSEEAGEDITYSPYSFFRNNWNNQWSVDDVRTAFRMPTPEVGEEGPRNAVVAVLMLKLTLEHEDHSDYAPFLVLDLVNSLHLRVRDADLDNDDRVHTLMHLMDNVATRIQRTARGLLDD